MNHIEQRAALIELVQHGAVIHWLTEAAKNNDTDIINKLETIGDLAEQFAEDARELAANLDPQRNPGNSGMEAANA